jgi:hypothetical protein
LVIQKEGERAKSFCQQQGMSQMPATADNWFETKEILKLQSDEHAQMAMDDACDELEAVYNLEHDHGVLGLPRFSW